MLMVLGSIFKVKVKDQIMYFLVNVSPKGLDLALSNFVAG